MKIGFIGLGNMGAGMAANLLKSGHEVTAYNRSQDKVAALAEQGAKPAKSVAETCDGDIVITMLANDDAVEAVTFGDDGIIASLRPGATHVSSSTISVALSERLTAAHAEAGQHFVAAPVFGRPEAASSGKAFRGRGGCCRDAAGRSRRCSTRSANGRSLCRRTRRPPIW